MSAAVWPVLPEMASKGNTWLDGLCLLSFRQDRQQGVQIASSHAKVHRRIIFAHIREAAHCGSKRPAQCNIGSVRGDSILRTAKSLPR